MKSITCFFADFSVMWTRPDGIEGRMDYRIPIPFFDHEKAFKAAELGIANFRKLDPCMHSAEIHVFQHEYLVGGDGTSMKTADDLEVRGKFYDFRGGSPAHL